MVQPAGTEFAALFDHPDLEPIEVGVQSVSRWWAEEAPDPRPAVEEVACNGIVLRLTNHERARRGVAAGRRPEFDTPRGVGLWSGGGYARQAGGRMRGDGGRGLAGVCLLLAVVG